VLAYAITQRSASFVSIAEIARDGAWLTLLLGLLSGERRKRRVPKSILLATHTLWLTALLYGLAGEVGLVTLPASVKILGPLLLALVGLVLVEQLYRNTQVHRRWAIKFLVLGVGGLFAYDLFIYSQALLLRHLDPGLWEARGAVNALVVPLIAVSAARNPEWSLNVFVSRHAVFYSASLIGAGIYLLVMAAGGYYVRSYGGNWGAVAEIVFLAGAALILAVIMLSAEARTQLRVFLIKHFYKNKYDYREEWLRLIATLATPAESLPLRERAIKAVAQIVDSPGGGLWMRSEEKIYEPAAQWQMQVPDTAVEPVESALVRFFRERRWVIDITDCVTNPWRYSGLTLPDWANALHRPWLLIPLMQEREVLGFIFLMQSPTFGKLTWEDTDLLKTVGQQIASYLGQQQAAQRLVEARQFDAYHRLTTYVMHDLKNLIAQQSLVVRNATRHKDNPDFIRDAIATIENSVRRMNQLLRQLQRGRLDGTPVRLILADLLGDVVASRSDALPAPVLEVLDHDIEVLADREGLGTVFGHIIKNAQDATAANGFVHVRLCRDADRAVIEVIDTGCGMDNAFVKERLFRPFDSTKGSKGMGIGAHEAREFIRIAGGEVRVTSAPGKGTTFRIMLPALPAVGRPQMIGGAG
jgi:putative PEP-CTERM system histidine kinase